MDIFKSQESNVQCYANNFPVVFESAKGCWMTDVDGKRYLDFLAGAGSLNYGHNNPTLKKSADRVYRERRHYSRPGHVYSGESTLSRSI